MSAMTPSFDREYYMENSECMYVALSKLRGGGDVCVCVWGGYSFNKMRSPSA